MKQKRIVAQIRELYRESQRSTKPELQRSIDYLDDIISLYMSGTAYKSECCNEFCDFITGKEVGLGFNEVEYKCTKCGKISKDAIPFPMIDPEDLPVADCIKS